MNHAVCIPMLLALGTLVYAQESLAQCDPDRPGAETARGTVYLDRDRDGRRDPGEPGVAAVPVSNGCRVVLSDPGGGYRIDLAPTEILFISKPARLALPLDEHAIPRFFYRHYPDGTPSQVAGTSVEWVFPVMPATGPLPETIDFALLEDPAAAPVFSAHGFADPQARFDLGQDMLREELVNTLLNNPYGVQFGITVGDVGFDNLAIYDRHKRMMALMDIPQWYLPGNHDVNYESPDARFANETYKLHFGPTYYSFDQGQVHFVALNNVEYAGAGNDGRYRGYISEVQLRWLENDLATVARDRLIVIATHIPLVAEASDGVSEPATGPGTENFGELLRLLEPFENIYGLAGHDTSNSWKVEVDHRHGWNGRPWIAHTLAEIRGNGWTRGPADIRGVRDAMMEDGNPNGFYLLKFSGVSLVPEFIPFPFGADAGQRLRITLDPPLRAPRGGGVNRGYLEPGTRLVVNLFDGGVRDSVWMSLDETPRRAMTYTVRTDPFVERVHRRFAGSDSAYGSATRSSHLWELPLPDAIGPGLHQVEVASEDEFGQRQWGSFTFEILPD